LNSVQCEVLWDTGAQVSVISKDFVQSTFPNMEIRPVTELIDTPLDLKAANGTSFPFVGWVAIDFELSDVCNSCSVTTPFLVAQNPLDLPIVGFNVIEEIVKNFDDVNNQSDLSILTSVLSANFPKNTVANIPGFIKFIQTPRPTELCIVKTVKQDVTIPKGKHVLLTCRANTGSLDVDTPALFEPELDGTHRLVSKFMKQL